MKVKKVLILDDDQVLCEELTDILRAEGFATDYVLTPEDGLLSLESSAYDILILDYKMPLYNGIEFLKRVKDKLGKIRIFIVSGSLKIDNMLKDNDLTHLVAAVIVKPFNIDMLLSRMRDEI